MTSPGDVVFPDIHRQLYHAHRTRWKDYFVHPYACQYWAPCFAVDKMSRDQLLAFQQKQLHELLEHAALHVPFYKKWALSAGFRPGDPIRLQDIPIVSKADYVSDIEAFQSDAYPVQQMMQAKTSGS